MPTGYRWNGKGWVKRKTAREIDYGTFEDEAWGLLVSYWRWYPDRFLDTLESENADFSLALVQRINLRALARNRETFITGSRGTSKTFTSFLSEMTDGVLWPGTVVSYFGPSQKQSAKLAADAFQQIRKNYPGLATHWSVKAQTKEKFEIRTDYGSVISITAMRGENSTQVLAEEVGQEELPQFDHQSFRSIVLPAVRLQHMVGKEPDETLIDFKKGYITSASRQQNDAYEYRTSILQGMTAGESCFAIDYPWQVAVLCGIRDVQWAMDLKRRLTPEEWLREMESRSRGGDEMGGKSTLAASHTGCCCLRRRKKEGRGPSDDRLDQGNGKADGGRVRLHHQERDESDQAVPLLCTAERNWPEKRYEDVWPRNHKVW